MDTVEIDDIRATLFGKCVTFSLAEPATADAIAACLGIRVSHSRIDPAPDEDLLYPFDRPGGLLTDGLLHQRTARGCDVVGMVYSQTEFGILFHHSDLVERATTFSIRGTEPEEDGVTGDLYPFSTSHEADVSDADLAKLSWSEMDAAQRLYFLRTAAYRARGEEHLRTALLARGAFLPISWHDVPAEERHTGESFLVLRALAEVLGLFLAAGNTALVAITREYEHS